MNLTAHNDKPKYIKLDELPSVLLFEISSYLNFSEALKFEKLNTSTFISSKISIKPLHLLNHTKFTKLVKYCARNRYVPKIRLFKSITINAENIVDESYDISDDDESDIDSLYNIFINHIFIRCESLTITSDYDMFGCGWSYVMHYLQFIKKDDLSNIRTFRLRLGFDSFTQNDAIMLQLITDKMKHIEYFECAGYFAEQDQFLQIDFQWLSRLIGISIYDESGNHDMQPIYSNIGNKIQSFHASLDDIMYCIHKLNNITELCITNWYLYDEDDTRDILSKQDFNFLQRIDLPGNVISEQNEILTLCMKKMIKNALYICVTFQQSYCTEYNIVHVLSKCMQFVNGKILKIRINKICLWKNKEINAFIKQLEQLLKQLNIYNSDWMLIVHQLEIATVIPLELMLDMNGMCESEFEFTVNDKIVNLQNMGLQRKNTNDFVDKFLERMKQVYCVHNQKILKETEFEEYDFAISNIDCCINGYNEEWNMTCTRCNQSPVFS
eukprot:538970_1